MRSMAARTARTAARGGAPSAANPRVSARDGAAAATAAGAVSGEARDAAVTSWRHCARPACAAAVGGAAAWARAAWATALAPLLATRPLQLAALPRVLCASTRPHAPAAVRPAIAAAEREGVLSMWQSVTWHAQPPSAPLRTTLLQLQRSAAAALTAPHRAFALWRLHSAARQQSSCAPVQELPWRRR